MRSKIHDVLPPKVLRSLLKFGRDLSVARKKRNLTVAMMAERLGVAKATYLRIEKGDPSVSMGAYAMTLFVLGFDDALTDLVDPGTDDQGLLLDLDRLPKRVRVKKEPTPL
ncbi:MAG: helix-turn-helix domain-containing protein [Deltaproteobacteria bacterium]|nr:helix-turn-helix domain-containing protein [Deltaproteobacteria bacterium]